jgi:UDP-3-O-[3-hydroxymyristoyl] glucosamine N-acyltransferase LpxD
MQFEFSELLSFLELNKLFYGRTDLVNDFTINGFSPISETQPHTISWMKEQTLNWENIKSSVVICSKSFETPDNEEIIFIPVENPRLVFTKLLTNFSQLSRSVGIMETVRVGNNCKFANDVYIGHYTVIGDNVTIGDNTEICYHVVIHDNTQIGKHCLIKSNTVIGEKGFGFDFEEDGTPIKIPYVGTVEIGNYVEIGALNTVVQATLGKTIIKDHVKTDDHIHIAHNVFID